MEYCKGEKKSFKIFFYTKQEGKNQKKREIEREKRTPHKMSDILDKSL